MLLGTTYCSSMLKILALRTFDVRASMRIEEKERHTHGQRAWELPVSESEAMRET